MQEKNKAIKIIGGGGISGLTAAINLAKSGYFVNIYEKNPDCGMRFNGGLQGIENWSEKIDALDELKSSNLKIEFMTQPFREVIFQEGEETIENEYQKPFFYLVRRGNSVDSLDQSLKKQAISLGVKIFFNKKIDVSDADIVATGPFESRLKGFIKGIRFRTDFRNIAIGLSSKGTSTKAYAYLLVANGIGCICSCSELLESTNLNKNLKEAVGFFKKKYNIYFKDIEPIGGYSTAHLTRRYKIGGKLYVGEAAGLQDYLFGFGIRYAIQSGFLAADSIINNYDYKKAAEKKFEKRMKIAIVNRLIWRKFEDANYKLPALLFRIFRNRVSLFSKIYNGDIFRQILFPLARCYIKEKLKNNPEKFL